jgi:hypothetical protein
LARRRLGLHVPRQRLDLLTHLGKKLDNRFFPLQEGTMDLVTGGESKVHARRINTRAAFGNPPISDRDKPAPASV